MSLNDPTRGTVYFAGGVEPTMGTITCVFTGNWTEWTTIQVNDLILSGAIDEVGGFVYFGTYGGLVLKLDVSTFSVVDQIDLGTSEPQRCGFIDAGT